MKKTNLFICSFIVIVYTAGCGPSSEVLDITMIAQTDEASALTLAAMPTETPTQTPSPTSTITPSPTPTSTLTPTPLPTFDSSVGCTDAFECVVIPPDDPIHIAYILTTSGWTSFLGEDSKGAIEIAIDDHGGKLFDRDILLTGEDSFCSAEGGIMAVNNVVEDSTILGVIGTNCSSAATVASPIISKHGLVMLSPSNTAPALTIAGATWQPGYYRIAHTDLLQGIFMAEFIFKELGARTAATIHDRSPYSEQLQQVFANHFIELGGTITYQGAINVGDTDMRPVLDKVAEDTPDVLYFPIFEPEGPYIVYYASEITGLENTKLVSADGLLSDSFPENSGPNVVGMYLSGPYVSGKAYDTLLSKWKDKFGGVPTSGFHAFAYDATNILLYAIEKVATIDDAGNIYIGRQALRNAISDITNYQGITGTLNCSDKDFPNFGVSKGDCATGESLGIFEITQAELDGHWPPPIIYTP